MNSKVADSKVKKPRRVRSERVELSSGNVFADLGFSDAEERLRKAQVAVSVSVAKVKGSCNKAASEVAREGPGLARQREEKLTALRKELAIGLDQLDRGECVEYASVEQLFDDIQADAIKRTAKKPKTR
jgi:hypothetical protein